MLGYARVLVWELPFFGGNFVIWRIVIAIPLPIVAGLLARWLAAHLARREAAPMIFFVDGLLWVIAIALGLIAASRSRALVRNSVREGVTDCIELLPRIMLGVIGSGYIAAILPQEIVGRWLGADSGASGLAIAVLGGALTPGGPVIGFSIGAAALKGGAGTPQVIAYTIAWALFAVQRLFLWEMPVMPERLVWVRVAASLPLPFLAALGSDAARPAVTLVHGRRVARHDGAAVADLLTGKLWPAAAAAAGFSPASRAAI